jgi:flagellar biosynthesis protein|tara:strand:+ start:1992 stop:2261 length:270 start_codon:yes stop_codon:yes gene_type:complete
MSSKPKYSKKAAALSYSGVGAPILVAKGEGDRANLIVEAGKESEIPIIEGEELSSYLQKVSIGSEIPQALFESVAIVLSWAYWLRGKNP